MPSKSRSKGTWALKVAVIAAAVVGGVEIMKKRAGKAKEPKGSKFL